MTAPTAPTAPLPSELEDAIERTDDMAPYSGYDPDEQGQIALFRHLYESDWQLIRSALLEAREQRQEFSQRLHRTAQILVEEFGAYRPSNADEVAQRAVERYNELRQQLAASERTCAELRVVVASEEKHVIHWQRQTSAYQNECAKLRTRAEAAERKLLESKQK